MAEVTDYYTTTSRNMSAQSYTVVGGYGNGSYNYRKLTETSFVRCVRAEGVEQELYTREADNKILVDNRNSLMWEDSIESLSNVLDKDDAVAYCEALELGSYTDWYLPGHNEMKLLHDHLGLAKWSDVLQNKSQNNEGYTTLNCSVVRGDLSSISSSCSEAHITRCMRDDTSKSTFTLHDEVLDDSVTGLTWAKTIAKNNEQNLTKFEDSLSYCDTLTTGGYSDWRMANINELITITNSAGVVDKLFTNIYNGIVSSTSPVHWFERDLLEMSGHWIGNIDKDSSSYINRSTACVRGGE